MNKYKRIHPAWVKTYELTRFIWITPWANTKEFILLEWKHPNSHHLIWTTPGATTKEFVLLCQAWSYICFCNFWGTCLFHSKPIQIIDPPVIHKIKFHHLVKPLSYQKYWEPSSILTSESSIWIEIVHKRKRKNWKEMWSISQFCVQQTVDMTKLPETGSLQTESPW